jgi:hypothetical protein
MNYNEKNIIKKNFEEEQMNKTHKENKKRRIRKPKEISHKKIVTRCEEENSLITKEGVVRMSIIAGMVLGDPKYNN